MKKKNKKNKKTAIQSNKRLKFIRGQKDLQVLGGPFERDDFHYMILGYTSGGASYGVTWEEAEAMGLLEDSGEISEVENRLSLSIPYSLSEDIDESMPF